MIEADKKIIAAKSWSITYKKPYKFIIQTLEIKLCGLGPRIRDVEAFFYKTEIKIVYFEPLCSIVSDFMVYPDPKFLISKTKKQPHFFFWG